MRQDDNKSYQARRSPEAASPEGTAPKAAKGTDGGEAMSCFLLHPLELPIDDEDEDDEEDED